MLNALKPYLENHFVLACSGGVDSMVLADQLVKTLPNPQMQIELVYIDHNQRTIKERKKDFDVVLNFALTHALICVKVDLKIPKKSSEDLMRKKRYEILTKFAAQNGSILLTAHHKDDVLESILFRLMRGSHPETIQSIAAIQEFEIPKTKKKVMLIRPLLEMSKKEIYQYAKKAKLEWTEDSTNQSNQYARNRIRNELIPLLEQIRSNASHQIYDFFQILIRQNQKRAHLTKQVDLNEPSGLEVKKMNFIDLKRSIDRELGENSQRTTKAHWENLRRQIELRHATKNGGGPQKSLQFPGGYQIEFKGNRLFWKQSQ